MTVARTLTRLAGALAFGASALHAQGPSTIVSINPFLPLAGYFQGELEARVRDNLALAVSGSHVELGDVYTSGDVKLRFYPTGRALEGFALAMGAGVGRIRDDDSEFLCIPDVPGSSFCRSRVVKKTGPTASVELHYQWLLGKSRNTAVTLGGGMKRYFVDTDDFGGLDILNEYVPTLRLGIGYAFRS